MRKFILVIIMLAVQGCSTEFLVHKANNALQYGAIVQLPKKDVIGQDVYLGGEIATVDRSANKLELVNRKLNASGYPEQGTNQYNSRILVNLLPSAQFDYSRNFPGDRVAVLGKLIDIQEVEVAGTTITILEVDANDYRSWNSRPTYWEDDPFYWSPYYRGGVYRAPFPYYRNRWYY